MASQGSGRPGRACARRRVSRGMWPEYAARPRAPRRPDAATAGPDARRATPAPSSPSEPRPSASRRRSRGATAPRPRRTYVVSAMSALRCGIMACALGRAACCPGSGRPTSRPSSSPARRCCCSRRTGRSTRRRPADPRSPVPKSSPGRSRTCRRCPSSRRMTGERGPGVLRDPVDDLLGRWTHGAGESLPALDGSIAGRLRMFRATGSPRSTCAGPARSRGSSSAARRACAGRSTRSSRCRGSPRTSGRCGPGSRARPPASSRRSGSPAAGSGTCRRRSRPRLVGERTTRRPRSRSVAALRGEDPLGADLRRVRDLSAGIPHTGCLEAYWM